jgi:hypothetical protein
VSTVDLSGRLRRHERSRATLARIGAELAPVLVIDDFLADPAVLVDYAASDSHFDATTDTFYPGVRAALPAIYLFAVRAFLGQAIAAAFGMDAAAVPRELGYFSLVTRPPQELHPLQRLPHTDSADPNQIAVLHYLCGEVHGGTSFYRHRQTGFESISEARQAAYQRAVAAEHVGQAEPPPGYICGDDRGYERIASFAAAVNRVLVYRGMHLHSADIQPGFACASDPRAGRLTANTFWYYR